MRELLQDYYGNQLLASTQDLLSTSGWRELKSNRWWTSVYKTCA